LAEFKTNQLTPPLKYTDEFFDLIYSISVFTHLSEHVQKEWMRELNRVLKKNGFVLITVHGEWRINDLNCEEKSRFRAGEMVVKCEQYEGSNVCAAYHPEAYIRNKLAQGFEVVDFMPTGAIDVGQDVYLFRKPA
jgi:SAM-dependent methyltransferase